MRKLIYFSGIAGVLFLLIWLAGTFIELPVKNVFVIAGLGLLILVFLPLLIYDHYRQNKRIDEIIKSYEGKESKDKNIRKGEKQSEGWNMNNSPFRSRRSGLSWGGGNIKASNATRGTRKNFLGK